VSNEDERKSNASETTEQLIAAGKLERAAQRLEQQGRLGAARELYEQLWDFSSAARVARRADDIPATLLNELRGGDALAVQLTVDSLGDADVQTLAACALVCEQRGEPRHAAVLRERAGQFELARAHYERAGSLADAARLARQSGDTRGAIELYRRQLARQAEPALTNDSSALVQNRIRFELAQLLLHHGRHEEALPLLQPLWQHATPLAKDAAIGCIAALQRAGYSRAARATLAAIEAKLAISLSLEACLTDERFLPLETESERVVLAGRYRLDELVGSGGMSRVYRATDLVRHQRVAVKVFSALGGARGREGRRRFVREALLTGKLAHPNIVSCLDYSDDGFMVLEYMGGGNLASRVPPALPLSACRTIMLQLLSGLLAAHQHGIVHRDIKPSNIFFNDAGVAKLGDFGVAHLQDQRLTRTGAVIGTLAFMSPEQIRGDTISFASDLYALGATLHTMLTGRHPYEPPDILKKHLESPVPQPCAVNPALPSVCDAVIGRCMAKEPHDRYPSLDALRDHIKRLPARASKDAPSVTAAIDSTPIDTGAATLRYLPEGRPRRLGDIELIAARDRELGRPVVLVRFLDPSDRSRARQLLRAAARGNERLQRVLALSANVAVLASDPESWPHPCSQLPTPLELCRQLAQALIPLHDERIAHGAIERRAVRCIDDSCELSLVRALERLGAPNASLASLAPAADVSSIAQLTRLALPEGLKDASALARWAEREQQRQREAERTAHRETQLHEALKTAPRELLDRLAQQRDD
jgi:serine/threonine protein kinase